MGHLLVCHPLKHWRMESRAQVIQVLAVCLTQETKNHKGANMILEPEDEAFNEIEQQAQQRREAVRRSLILEEARNEVRAMLQNRSINPYRDQVIEEVAQHIEKMTGFGQDTINSFAIYIRGLK